MNQADQIEVQVQLICRKPPDRADRYGCGIPACTWHKTLRLKSRSFMELCEVLGRFETFSQKVEEEEGGK